MNLFAYPVYAARGSTWPSCGYKIESFFREPLASGSAPSAPRAGVNYRQSVSPLSRLGVG